MFRIHLLVADIHVRLLMFTWHACLAAFGLKVS